MRLTVLGACGAYPEAGQACSGYLIEHDGFRLIADLGYATVPRLLELMPAGGVDAVVISHGHPDHCADLNPLLRARVMADEPAPPLPVYAPAGALDAVLALDRPGMLASGLALQPLEIGGRFTVGPFTAETRLLPHFLPNAGLRLAAGGVTLAYTGDSGPSPQVVELARGADLLLAEATSAGEISGDLRGYLSSARDTAREATEAGAGRLMLTHLWPGTDHAEARAAAATEYGGDIEVARAGLVLDLG
jgi:ribonuclease BN (tRNA processing enzyme)